MVIRLQAREVFSSFRNRPAAALHLDSARQLTLGWPPEADDFHAPYRHAVAAGAYIVSHRRHIVALVGRQAAVQAAQHEVGFRVEAAVGLPGIEARSVLTFMYRGGAVERAVQRLAVGAPAVDAPAARCYQQPVSRSVCHPSSPIPSRCPARSRPGSRAARVRPAARRGLARLRLGSRQARGNSAAISGTVRHAPACVVHPGVLALARASPGTPPPKSAGYCCCGESTTMGSGAAVGWVTVIGGAVVPRTDATSSPPLLEMTTASASRVACARLLAAAAVTACNSAWHSAAWPVEQGHRGVIWLHAAGLL